MSGSEMYWPGKLDFTLNLGMILVSVSKVPQTQDIISVGDTVGDTV